MTGRSALIATISEQVMRWQDATQAYDDTVGALYGLNPAERHCLSLLWSGPQPPGIIAQRIGLTPPSVTALVDRLERRGFLTRERDPDDRRRMRIAITAKTRALTERVYLPLAAEGAVMLGSFAEAELAAIARFVSEATRLQEAAADRLRAGARPGDTVEDRSGKA
jgi:DNA-binding MarR family transcriptional regulator